MLYRSGGELFHQIVKLTYFSEELSRHVILQVAHSIRYLHEEKGVVHRQVFLAVVQEQDANGRSIKQRHQAREFAL